MFLCYSIYQLQLLCGALGYGSCSKWRNRDLQPILLQQISSFVYFKYIYILLCIVRYLELLRIPLNTLVVPHNVATISLAT